MKKVTRIATLTEDATLYKDSVQLHYKRRGFSSLGSGPPRSCCPPIEKLKRGTKIRITYNTDMNQILHVALASEER